MKKKKELEVAEEKELELDEMEVPTVEIPAYVDKLLKMYNEEEALYIDSKGGVYKSDTQLKLSDNAILYQNPYYKQ